jgi:hypothetical protein
MMMNLKTGVIAATTAAALMIGSTASASVGKAAGLLPGDCDVVFALSLKAMDDPQSLLSFVPRAELEKMAFESLQSEGGITGVSESAAVAASKLAFLGSQTGSRTDFMAVGTRSSDAGGAQPPRTMTVLLGEFNNVAGSLTSIGATAGEGNVFALPASEGTITAASPETGVIAISEDSGWVSSVNDTVTAGSNLTAAGSAFNKIAGGLAGKAPDALIYLDAKPLIANFGGAPEVQAMAGPVLKTQSIMLVLLPGSTPSAELHLSFPTDADAQLCKAWADSMIQLGKVQLMQAAQGVQASGDPSAIEQFNNINQMVNSVTTANSGTSMVLRLPVNNLPNKEEFKAKLLEGAREAMSGGLGSINPLGGGF